MASGERTALYKQTCELGSGVLGTLSAGQSPERAVMLRQIVAREPWTESQIDAVESASRAAKVVHDPSLLSIINVQRSGKELLIASEYIEGVPLATLMKRGQKDKQDVPVGVALRIVAELSRAVANLNALPPPRTPKAPISWVHPECVVLSSGDDAMLCDIGILSLESVPQHSELSELRAPELKAGLDREAADRACVYSLGALLQQLLARRKTLDPAIRKIIERATNRDAKQRFDGPRDLADALSEQAKSEPGSLVALMNDLAPDLMDRQRATLVVPHAAGASWRPTLTGLEQIQVPKIPGAPGTGLPELETKRMRSVEIMVEDDAGEGPTPVQAAAVPLTRPRAPQETLPLLLVNKPPEGHEAGDTEPDSAPPRRDRADSEPELDSVPPTKRGRGATLAIMAIVAGVAVAVFWASTRDESPASPGTNTPAAAPSASSAPTPSPSATTTAATPATAESVTADAAAAPTPQPNERPTPRWSSAEERKKAADEAAKTMLAPVPPPPEPSTEHAPLSSDNPY